MTQHKQPHGIKWHDHHIKWHDMTCHVATNHSSSPHVTSQPTTLLHLTPQAISWFQNRSHQHHGTAEGSFTAKKWFGHRAGRSSCAHSISKFFLCYIYISIIYIYSLSSFFFWNFRPRLARELLVILYIHEFNDGNVWSGVRLKKHSAFHKRCYLSRKTIS